MKISIVQLAWIGIGAAICAAVGLFFFVQTLQERSDTLEQAIERSQKTQLRVNEEQKAVALLLATESNRTQLQRFLTIDLLSLAGIVVAAGEDAGVTLHVSNAVPEKSAMPVNKGGAVSTGAVSFTIEADGSFTKLFDALALLEALPAP